MPKESPQDSALRKLAQSGSREELARALAPLALGILVRREGSVERAKGALPEAVRLLVASRKRWARGVSSRAWALSTLRVKGGAGARPAEPGPALAGELRSRLDSLPAEPREALELVAIEGLSFGEAAELMGQPSAVVEQRAALAFAELASASRPEGASASGGCASLREALLARALGKLSTGELAELDAHSSSCPGCKSLVETSGKTMALLRAYREATDIAPDEATIGSVLDSLAAREDERARRAEKARKTQAESSRPAVRRLLVGAAVALVLVAAAGLAIRLTLFKVEPPRPNPLLELLAEVNDSARARDLACALDIQLQEEWAREAVRERRIAALMLARWLARREGFADSLSFLKAILSEHARTAGVRPSRGVVLAAEREDPLRLAGELKQAGLHARAAEVCARVAASAPDEPTRARALLHGAASLLLEGRLDEADSALSALGGGSGAAGDGLVARLVPLMQKRLARARESREAMKTYVRPKPDESDYRGGELGLEALDRDYALRSLAGAEQPILVGLLTSAWVRLLAGDVRAARVDLSACFRAQKRFTKSLAQLALAEAAFLEGRWISGLGHLQLAQEYAPDTEGVSQFVSMVSLQQGLRELVELGSAPRADGFLKATEQTAALRELLDSTFAPRIAPLAAKRDEVTKDWPKSDSPFHKVLGRTPGSVVGTDALLASFEQGPAGLVPASGGALSAIEGLSGKGVRVESSGGTASVELALDVPEVETWVIFAARPAGPGRFELRAASADGRRYRWRTFLLAPGEWNRLAVPLGALEPEESTGGEDSILTRRIASVGFSFEPWREPGVSEPPAQFDLDELVVRHGQKTEEQGLDAPVSR